MTRHTRQVLSGSVLLFALSATLHAADAAADEDPASRSFGRPQPPAPVLTPEEQEQLEQELLEQELLDEQRRPPAKRAPLQSGAKQAPGDTHPESGAEARERTQTPRQVSGTILGMKLVEVRGTGEQNVIVLVKTHKGDRRLPIDLGPVSQLEGADLRVGGGIAAEGYVVAVRDQQFLVATRVKPQGSPVLDIRRTAQARLAHGGVAPTPSAEPPVAPKPDTETLPPLEGLERGPLPPSDSPTEDGAEIVPRPITEPREQPSRKERQRRLVEEQQRPGGD